MNTFSIALFLVKKMSSTRLSPNVQHMSKNGSILPHISKTFLSTYTYHKGQTYPIMMQLYFFGLINAIKVLKPLLRKMCTSTKTHNTNKFKAIFSKWPPAQSSTINGYNLQPSFLYHFKQQTLRFPNIYTSKNIQNES